VPPLEHYVLGGGGVFAELFLGEPVGDLLGSLFWVAGGVDEVADGSLQFIGYHWGGGGETP